MMSVATAPVPAPADAVDQQREVLMDRLLNAATAVFDVHSIYVGDRLGYYRALADAGALTSSELAAQTSTHERYAREWLEHQAVTGILRVEHEHLDASARRYHLLPGYVEVLTDQDSLNYLAPLAQITVACVRPMDKVIDCFRTGGGLPFSEYGEDARGGQAAMNRAMFLRQLGQEFLPKMTDVHARLKADPPAHVADIGCGVGWSSIGIARAYPKARVDGFDLDEPSIVEARRIAQEAGLDDRVSFQCRDVGDATLAGRYDLVAAFECIHDLSDPVTALSNMRSLAGDQGAVLVMDERVGDRFSQTGNEIEALMYGFSMFHCLPSGMNEHPRAGTGTVMRPDTLRDYARRAGFRDVEILPIDSFFFRFYRLHG